MVNAREESTCIERVKTAVETVVLSFSRTAQERDEHMLHLEPSHGTQIWDHTLMMYVIYSS